MSDAPDCSPDGPVDLSDDQQQPTEEVGVVGDTNLGVVMLALLVMGLINYLREKARPVNISVPDIKKDKHAWYNHYDEDKNGSLQQDEVVRGLIQTFRFGHDPQRMQAIKQTVQAVWCIFDNDGSGSIDGKW